MCNYQSSHIKHPGGVLGHVVAGRVLEDHHRYRGAGGVLEYTPYNWLSSMNMVRVNRDKWRKYVHGVTNPRIEDG